MSEIEIIWQQLLMLIKDQISERDYKAWVEVLHLRSNESKLEVVAANNLVHKFVAQSFWNKISLLLSELSGGVEASLVVSSAKKPLDMRMAETTQVNNTAAVASQPASTVENTVPNNVVMPEKAKPPMRKMNSHQLNKAVEQQVFQASNLNAKLNFDNLVCGEANKIAYAIGSYIAESDEIKTHNPLFIYGGVGLGKTHLMQAIGNKYHGLHQSSRVRYFHANEYIQDISKASQNHAFDELRKTYHGFDFILVDDIQFIANAKKSQEEFTHTLAYWLEKGKQVIIAADKMPRNITDLNDRLVSRLISGLQIEILPPDINMRVAILKSKAKEQGVLLDDDVAFFIAQNIKSNVRELEGALNKVIYHAKFAKKGLSIELAKEALMDLLESVNRAITIEDIMKVVCDYYKVKLSDLLSNKRTSNIALPRQIGMALAKDLTSLSFPVIGNAFGGRDHTTALYAQKKIREKCAQDVEFERQYKIILQILQN